MKRYLAHLLVFVCLFTVVLSVSGFIHPIHVYADVCNPKDADWDMSKCGEQRRASINPVESIKDALLFLPGWISIAILQVAQLLVWMSGVLLNKVVQFTVIDMAHNLEGVAINNAWATIRDVANMSFIFVLLYASIQLILGIGKNTRQLIVNMIIVALLINFSLFFTKVVIDSSNLLAVMFYKAIAPGVLTESFNGGIANTIMEPLKLQSIAQDVSALDGSKLIIIGVMGTIFCLIAAFIFFAISIMFVVRFAVLIFLLILSPIAFIAMILPQAGKYRSQWIDALMGQAFFAPIYFLFTWIVIVISKGLLTSDKGLGQALLGTTVENPQGQLVAKAGDIGIVMNFLIMIVFLVFSLVVAKQWAGRAGSGVSKATNWLTGKAGNAGFGAVGWSGRKSLGWAGGKIAENPNIVSNANDKNANWSTRASARLALYAGKKARSGTYDPRNMTIPTNAIGDAIQGTVGRTTIGKKLGLDDVNIAPIGVGKIASDRVGVGEAATKGQYELDAEKKKRILDREKAATDEATIVLAKRDIEAGAKTGATSAEIDDMEMALSKLSDKQTETLVAGNRDLLQSQEFANKISVQQLEALNKSEQLSEDEKNVLKANRFKEIRDGLSALAVAPAARTTAQADLAKKASARIKGLSDKELEMISAEDVVKPEFIAEMRGPQFETIAKSNKFTSGQKKAVKDARKEPLLKAFNTAHPSYTPANMADEINKKIKKMSGKDYAELMREKINYVDYRGTPVTDEPLLAHPEILTVLKPNMLKKMALELNGDEINTLRTALEGFAGTDATTRAWLINPTTGGAEFA